MTQTIALKAEPAPHAAAQPQADARLDVTIHRALADVETAWRELERTGLVTPYQRYDWLDALLAAGAEASSTLAIALVSRNERPVAILPLVIDNQYGAKRARMLGAEQSNGGWIVSDANFHPTPAQLSALFTQIARAAGGIDVLLLTDQLASWGGVPNPVLGLPHAPAASNLYTTTIGGTPVPYLEHRMTTKRRSNINRGRRRLEELFGPVRLVRVEDGAMLERVHREFLEQRGARFTEMGVPNIFARAPFPQFFRQLTTAGFGSARPALCAHALFAGEEIVATSWGAMAGNHYSQYINSTAPGPAARYSLTGILLGELMDELLPAGIETFDLGLGDFDYKIEWTEPQPVFNSVIALSIKGRIAAAVTQRRGALKRLIKQTPAFWQAAKWVRRHLLKLGRH